jgi:multidrug efflux pump subunit AcrA (membrane-fusion protein)
LFGAFLAAVIGCGPSNEYQPPPPPTVTVAKPVQKTVTIYLEETGTTEAVQNAEVRARVKGFLEQIRFASGAEVKEGDVLYVIEKREYKARVASQEAQLNAAKVEKERAQIESNRQNDLFKDNATAETNVVQAMAELKVAEAAIVLKEAELDQTTIDLEYTDVLAPINGRVGKTLVKKGNLVGDNEATHLTTIVSYDPIYANFNISERALLELLGQDRGENVEGSLDYVSGTTAADYSVGEAGPLRVSVAGYLVKAGEFVIVNDDEKPDWNRRPTWNTVAATGPTDTDSIALSEALGEKVPSGAVVTIFKAATVRGGQAVGYDGPIALEHTAGKAPQVGQLLAFGLDEGRHTYLIIQVDKISDNQTNVILQRPLDFPVADSESAFPGPVMVLVYLARDIDKGFPYVGRLEYADLAVDQSTGTFMVRAILDNRDRDIIPGLFVRVRIPIGVQENALLVPERATGSDQAGKYLYVVNNENTVERRDVTVGAKHEGLVVITAGLLPQDRVITDGVQRARPGAEVTPKEETLTAGEGGVEIIEKASEPPKAEETAEQPDAAEQPSDEQPLIPVEGQPNAEN